jgi:hypothetical protein
MAECNWQKKRFQLPDCLFLCSSYAFLSNLLSQSTLPPTASFTIFWSPSECGYKRRALAKSASFTSILNHVSGNVLPWNLSTPPMPLITPDATFCFWFQGFISHTCCPMENYTQTSSTPVKLTEHDNGRIQRIPLQITTAIWLVRHYAGLLPQLKCNWMMSPVHLKNDYWPREGRFLV